MNGEIFWGQDRSASWKRPWPAGASPTTRWRMMGCAYRILPRIHTRSACRPRHECARWRRRPRPPDWASLPAHDDLIVEFSIEHRWIGADRQRRVLRRHGGEFGRIGAFRKIAHLDRLGDGQSTGRKARRDIFEHDLHDNRAEGDRRPMTMTFSIQKPGAFETLFKTSSAPCGMRAMRRRASFKFLAFDELYKQFDRARIFVKSRRQRRQRSNPR